MMIMQFFQSTLLCFYYYFLWSRGIKPWLTQKEVSNTYIVICDQSCFTNVFFLLVAHTFLRLKMVAF